MTSDAERCTHDSEWDGRTKVVAAGAANPTATRQDDGLTARIRRRAGWWREMDDRFERLAKDVPVDDLSPHGTSGLQAGISIPGDDSRTPQRTQFAVDGGDPPCWAHLMDEESGAETCSGSGAVDLLALAQAFGHSGTAWTLKSDDLNANLLVLNDGGRSSEHVNELLDVLIVGISGSGIVSIDSEENQLSAGGVMLAPRGSSRSIRAVGGPFAYLTVHRRRGVLWPSPSVKPGDSLHSEEISRR